MRLGIETVVSGMFLPCSLVTREGSQGFKGKSKRREEKEAKEESGQEVMCRKDKWLPPDRSGEMGMFTLPLQYFYQTETYLANIVETKLLDEISISDTSLIVEYLSTIRIVSGY